MYPLSQTSVTSLNKTNVAAGTSDIDGAVIDMADFDAIEGIAALATVVDTCVLELQLMGSANADGSSPAVEATTGALAAASSFSNKAIQLDVYRPANRYVFFRLKRGTANATLNSITAKKYRPRDTRTDIVTDSSLLNKTFAAVG